jgi:hypothetical protein
MEKPLPRSPEESFVIRISVEDPGPKAGERASAFTGPGLRWAA